MDALDAGWTLACTVLGDTMLAVDADLVLEVSDEDALPAALHRIDLAEVLALPGPTSGRRAFTLDGLALVGGEEVFVWEAERARTRPPPGLVDAHLRGMGIVGVVPRGARFVYLLRPRLLAQSARAGAR